MKHDIDDTELATILAALRGYQADGFGDPANRPLPLHEIATNCGEIMSSLDDAGIDELCEKLNCAEDDDLTKILRCLIDTAERTTDLEGAYNDKADEFVSWEEIDAFMKKLGSTVTSDHTQPAPTVQHASGDASQQLDTAKSFKLIRDAVLRYADDYECNDKGDEARREEGVELSMALQIVEEVCQRDWYAAG